MADRIVVMNHGVIDQIGTPDEIYREPRTLFVAEFIGEMNRLDGVAEPDGRVRVGDVLLTCASHGLNPGAPAIVAVRPEEIVPREGPGANGHGANALDATVGELEFLGAFWRARLESPSLKGQNLVANFSVNAMRRLSLKPGIALTVDLPDERVRVFSRDGA